MARPKSEALTEREYHIMAVLWQLGEATADQIRSHLSSNLHVELHDSTVRTLLRVLVRKRYVRTRRGSRPAVYRPIVARTDAQQQAARGLLRRFFDGSAELLVLRLLEDEQLTPDQLDQLKSAYLPGQSE